MALHLAAIVVLLSRVAVAAEEPRQGASTSTIRALRVEADHSSFLQVESKGILHRGSLSPKLKQRIAEQLILTGKWNSPAEIPGSVGKNVRNTLALNPNLKVRWLSDAGCQDYLAKNFDKELVDIFARERRGSFRGDLCRAAVLSKEGGFYTDLDVQWRVPMQELVDEGTTFMSAYGQGEGEILNAVMAAEPDSKIMKAALQELRNWYKPGTEHQGWMGPATLHKALQDVQRESCDKLDMRAHTLEKVCGPHKLRLYEQRELRCHNAEECPPNRANSHFQGLKFGLFVPGPEGKLIGWPRFAECQSWGCGGGGWNERKASGPPKI